MGNRAAAYARISTKDKRVPKVANQLADLRKLAEQRGYELCGEYEDDGVSASNGEQRDGFDKLLEVVAAGEVDVVLATEEERFARTVGDKERLAMTCIAAAATWHTIRDGEVDPAVASGEFMSTVRAAVGRLESRRKAERQRAANAHHREKGLPHRAGPRPFGWAEDRMAIDPDEAALIRSGTEAVLAGRKLHSIVKDWNASTVKPPRAQSWTRISVVKALRRWRNAGVVAHHDEPLDGVAAQWQAIVSRDDLEAVRSILTTKGGQKRTPNHLCSGLALCHCGEVMIASGSNKTSAYMCSARVRNRAKPGPHASINVGLLDTKARKAVIDSYFVRPPDTLPSHDAEAAKLAQLWAERAEARRQIQEIQADRQAGVYTQAEAAREVGKYRDAEAQIDRAILERTSRSAHAAMLVQTQTKMVDGQRKVNFADAAKAKLELGKRFDALDLDGKRSLVESLLRITVHQGRGDERAEVEHLGAAALDEGAPFPG
jgi:DNA invertase Pin-like site-specific DNA recombinase